MQHGEHFQTIAQIISSSINDDWERGWVEGEVGEDTSSLQFWFLKPDGEKGQNRPSTLQSVQVSDALIALRSQMAQDGNKPWSRAVFTLTPDGKFNLEVSYDD